MRLYNLELFQVYVYFFFLLYAVCNKKQHNLRREHNTIKQHKFLNTQGSKANTRYGLDNFADIGSTSEGANGLTYNHCVLCRFQSWKFEQH